MLKESRLQSGEKGQSENEPTVEFYDSYAGIPVEKLQDRIVFNPGHTRLVETLFKEFDFTPAVLEQMMIGVADSPSYRLPIPQIEAFIYGDNLVNQSMHERTRQILRLIEAELASRVTMLRLTRHNQQEKTDQFTQQLVLSAQKLLVRLESILESLEGLDQEYLAKERQETLQQLANQTKLSIDDPIVLMMYDTMQKSLVGSTATPSLSNIKERVTKLLEQIQDLPQAPEGL